MRDPRPDELDADVDWSYWYLREEDDMGEGNEQGQIIDVLRSVLRQLARERGWSTVYVGADQFFAWVQEEPLVRVSPDVYLLDDPPAPPLPASWQTWKPGHRPPRFAVEIVSGDERHPERWRKDYDEAPQKYAQLGTTELVIFDPEVALGRVSTRERVALQVFRREVDGGFLRTYVGSGPVESIELGARLVVVTDGAVARLRIARAETGELVPTAEEAQSIAEAELTRLREELTRLRGG